MRKFEKSLLVGVWTLLMGTGMGQRAFGQHRHGMPVGQSGKVQVIQPAGDQTVRYDLYINDTTVNYTGKSRPAIAINGSIPGPTLYFTEGDTAEIYVHNQMHMETSIHWHGILLPNNQDGVPYLTTVPIRHGETYKFKFPVRQSGTYWYHSHTMLQEQSGVYGSIVIQPKEKKYKADQEQVLLLSDWTDEKPEEVLRTLKRKDAANEWYAIKKGYAQSLDQLLKHHAWGKRLKSGFNRMPPMDLSDVYYKPFLINGQKALNLTRFKPGEHVRLRVINGSSSTYFYIEFAGGRMKMISADGQDIQPVAVNRVLMGVAETYDFMVTIPDAGAYEFRATPLDVTGKASAFLGSGRKHDAKDIPRPDAWDMDTAMKTADVNVPLMMNHGVSMKNMSMKGMHMDMPGMDMEGKHEEMMTMPDGTKMKMSDMEDNDGQNRLEKEMTGEDTTGMMTMPDGTKMKMSDMEGDGHDPMQGMDHDAMQGEQQDTGFVMFNYNMLQALRPTTLPGKPDRNIVLNLTGNMYRYIWSFNNKTLSEKDSIQIRKGENVRMTFINNTMMNHPIHLHGHFFRVLNDHGEYSPLKHTVDVPPMRTVVVEFDANEAGGDWFLHCHILYQMMSGMTRYFHYEGSVRDSSLKNFPLKKTINDDKKWFFFGDGELQTHMAELSLNYANSKNAIRMEGSTNYKRSWEGELTYERYIGDWFRPFLGVSSTNEKYFNIFNNHQIFEQDFFTPVVGIRYTLPFFVESELRVNTAGRVRLQLEGEEWLLPRVMLNWTLNTDKEYHLDLQYMFTKYISATAGYDSRYQWGGGLSVRF